MKGPIERFDVTTEDTDLGHARGAMESDPKGDYVTFEDYDRLKELALKAACMACTQNISSETKACVEELLQEVLRG